MSCGNPGLSWEVWLHFGKKTGCYICKEERFEVEGESSARNSSEDLQNRKHTVMFVREGMNHESECTHIRRTSHMPLAIGMRPQASSVAVRSEG